MQTPNFHTPTSTPRDWKPAPLQALTEVAPRDKSSLQGWVNSFFTTHPEHDRHDSDKKYFLLVAYGSFNPIHKGHLRMIKSAKLALEDGYSPPMDENALPPKHVVIGTLIIPVAQEEIEYKYPHRPADQYPEALRLQLCQEATQALPNYFVHPSPTQTSPIELYWSLQADPRLQGISIAMVQGADNRPFFKEKQRRRPLLVVVGRSGYADSSLLNPFPEDTIFVDAPNPTLPCSSTQIRFALQQPVESEQQVLAQLPMGARRCLTRQGFFSRLEAVEEPDSDYDDEFVAQRF